MPRKGSSDSRGYGAAHQRARRELLPYAWGKPCTRCGQPLVRGDLVDLDHSEDRTHYLGFAHRTCNRSAGAQKRNAQGKGSGGSRAW